MSLRHVQVSPDADTSPGARFELAYARLEAEDEARSLWLRARCGLDLPRSERDRVRREHYRLAAMAREANRRGTR